MAMASPKVKHSGGKIVLHLDLWAGATLGKEMTKRYYIGMYNVRTLKTEDRIFKLDEELGKISWDIIRMADVH